VPNLIQAKEFLDALEPGGVFAFQTFDDGAGKRPELARVIIAKGADATLNGPLAELNARGAGVFTTVNRTDGKARGRANVTAIRALFIDADGVPRPDVWHRSPSIKIRRDDTHYHAYWLLNPAEVERTAAMGLEERAALFYDAQKRLAAHYGADPAINDLSRVMRLPGFMHCKADPVPVTLDVCDPLHRMTVGEVLAGVPELPKAVPAAPAPRGPAAPVSQDRAFVFERARKFMARQEPAMRAHDHPQDSHRWTFQITACLLNGFQLTRGEARQLLDEWNATCPIPWQPHEIEHKLDEVEKAAPDSRFPRGWLLNASPPRQRGAVHKGSEGLAESDTEIDVPGESMPEIADRPQQEAEISEAGQPANPLTENPPPSGEEPPKRSSGAGRVPTGDLAAWFDGEFDKTLSDVCALVGTMQDAAVLKLFDELAARLPGVSVVTKARVKKSVCDRLKLGLRDYDKALIEATMRLEARADSGWMNLAERYVRWLWEQPTKRCLRYWREEWYEWNACDGCYVQQGFSWVRGELNKWLCNNGQEVTCNNTKNFLNALEAVTILHNSIVPGSWIKNAPPKAADAIYFSMRNGILNLCERAEIIPHTPDFFTLNSVPFAFDPKAACPKWQAATLQWQPMDETASAYQTLQDWMGYLFIPFNPHKKFLVCTGPGDDGKSVYARLCREIVGRSNCESVPLEMFDPSIKGGLQSLLGKMLNQIGDANIIERVAEGTLKSLTGNDPYTFSRLYLTAITEVWPGKVMINANATPYWRDRSNALFNRMLPLHWQTIPAAMMNPGLVAELIAEELPGIFNWAMEGFDRMRKQGFNRTGRVSEWVEDARNETQAELEFFDTCVEYDLNPLTCDRVYCSALMAAYKRHCEAMNHKVFCNDRTLGRQLREWLRRRFKREGIPDGQALAFLEKLNGRDGMGVNSEYKRKTFYRGIRLLKDDGS
jgi:P4 family phage/plasmid primase-like protien